MDRNSLRHDYERVAKGIVQHIGGKGLNVKENFIYGDFWIDSYNCIFKSEILKKKPDLISVDTEMLQFFKNADNTNQKLSEFFYFCVCPIKSYPDRWDIDLRIFRMYDEIKNLDPLGDQTIRFNKDRDFESIMYLDFRGISLNTNLWNPFKLKNKKLF